MAQIPARETDQDSPGEYLAGSGPALRAGGLSGAVQWVRRVKPQTGQVATPLAASTCRKLAHPFVRQYGRPVLAAACEEARRRSRRMELARPAYVAVADRVIIWLFLLRAFWRATGGWGLGSDPCYIRSACPELGGASVLGGPGGVSGASVVETLDRGRRCGPVTYRS